MLTYNIEEARNRRILKRSDVFNEWDPFEDVYADPELKGLLETDLFLKAFEAVTFTKISRRTLQLYTSPGLKLMPLPVHRGGYKSYYLNPEHINWLELIVHLQKDNFPLNQIQRIMHNLPESYHRFILFDVLEGFETLRLAEAVKKGVDIRDFIYHKAYRLFATIDRPENIAADKYNRPYAHFDGEPLFRPSHVTHAKKESFMDRELTKEALRFAKWIKQGRRKHFDAVVYNSDYKQNAGAKTS